MQVDHGAPVRLRVPTYGGDGGYWKDQGYEWYTGI
jgi:hypothetical protein